MVTKRECSSFVAVVVYYSNKACKSHLSSSGFMHKFWLKLKIRSSVSKVFACYICLLLCWLVCIFICLIWQLLGSSSPPFCFLGFFFGGGGMGAWHWSLDSMEIQLLIGHVITCDACVTALYFQLPMQICQYLLSKLIFFLYCLGL